MQALSKVQVNTFTLNFIKGMHYGATLRPLLAKRWHQQCIMLWDSVLTLSDVFTVTDIEHIITELCRSS